MRVYLRPYDPYQAQFHAGAGSAYPHIDPEDYYLLGARVGAREAIRLAFRHALAYRGRASRSACWWFALFLAAAGYGLDRYLSEISAHADSADVTLFIGLGPVLIVAGWLLAPALALAVRRLHDIDRSGWWVLLGLVPPVGAVGLLVLSLVRGSRGPNRYT